MNAALVVMTILGCNDAGTNCKYVATVENRWPTIEMCDAVAEQHLTTHADQPYPMIIAVCQKPEPQDAEASVAMSEQSGKLPESAVSPQERDSFASRAIDRVRTVLPTTEGVRTLMNTPIRLVEDSYSWVARKFQR